VDQDAQSISGPLRLLACHGRHSESVKCALSSPRAVSMANLWLSLFYAGCALRYCQSME
jgi:hypothetical protein